MLPERDGTAGVAKVTRDRELCVPLSCVPSESRLRGGGFIRFCNLQACAWMLCAVGCANTAGQAPAPVFTLLPGQPPIFWELSAARCQRAEDQGQPQQPCQPCPCCCGHRALQGSLTSLFGGALSTLRAETAQQRDLHGLVEILMLSQGLDTRRPFLSDSMAL